MNTSLNGKAIPSATAIACLRILTGIFLIIHGVELFDASKMAGYVKWDVFAGNSWLPYVGKAAELVAGVSLLLGWFTRVGAVIAISTFAYITFFVGNGRFWMEDQHPFLLVMFGVLFLITGPGKWSIDRV